MYRNSSRVSAVYKGMRARRCRGVSEDTCARQMSYDIGEVSFTGDGKKKRPWAPSANMGRAGEVLT